MELNNHIISPEEFAILANAAPALIWASDMDGNIHYLNEAWLRFTGSSSGQGIGRNWEECVHPDDLPTSQGQYLSAFKARVECKRQYRLRKNGQYRWIADHSTPRFDKQGNFAGYVGSCLDIHESIESQQLIATNPHTSNIQQTQTQRFFMQAPAGICILDGPDFVFELVNPFYQQLFPGRVLLGKPLAAALPELTSQPIWQILHQVYHTNQPYEGRELMVPLARTNDGPIEERYFNFIYQPRLNQQKMVDGVLVFVIEVTDSFLKGRQLRERETSLTSLIMTSHYALMILRGRDWTIEIANQQIATLWEKKLNDIIGKKLMTVLPELEGQPYPALLNQVMDTAQPYSQEEEVLWIESPEGRKQRFVNFFYDPMIDVSGEVVGVIVACEDITEQVHAKRLLENSYEHEQTLNEELYATNEELSSVNEELAATNEELAQTQEILQDSLERLRITEDRFRSFVAAAPFPIAVYEGREMRIVLANQAVMDVWGKGNDVIGKCYAEILPELGDQGIYPLLDQVFTSGKAFHGRDQQVDLVINNVLQPFYFNYSFTPLFDAEGKVYGVMNTAADVTDLHIAKQKVEQNEQNLHNMILQAPVAICILLGEEHTITVANELMIELWGKPRQDVINKPVFEALPDARGQGLEEAMATVLNTGEPFIANSVPVELIRHGKPETVYQNFVYAPYRDSEGKIQGLIAITIDVTSHVLAKMDLQTSEAELRETKQHLEQKLEAGRQIQRQKDDFIGMASHELKTPLTSLTAIVQLLQRTLKDGAQSFVPDALEKANHQVRRMTYMINSFLNISRLESGKILIEKESFLLDDLLRSIIDETRLIVSSHTIELKPTRPISIYADPDKIGSVISNLISNAVKYSKSGTSIILECELEANWITVHVTDQGMGIHAADREKIFERYWRVESSRTQHIAGFGIGLYLSAEIINRHDGKIWVESEPDRGSRFSFSLPLSS